MISKRQCQFAFLVLVMVAANELVWAVGKTVVTLDITKCHKSTDSNVVINYCTQAIESGQLSGKGLGFAFYSRGNAYYEKRNYDRAIQNYDEVIRLNPNHAKAFSNRGIAYGRKGDYDRAIENYNEAIRLNPNHANALYNRGNAYKHNKDYDRAVLDYDKVIRLNPNHADAYSNRGLVRFYQGQFSAAVPDLSQAVGFAPTNLYRILLLYLAQARAGSHAQEGLAQATVNLDLKEWPGPVVSMYLGKIPEHVVFDAVADADPTKQRQKRCQAYFYVGQQLLIRQSNSEATKMFRETVATNASTLFEYEGAQAELKHLGN